MLQWKRSVKHSDILDNVDKVSFGIRSVTVTSHNVTLYDIFDYVDKVSYGIRSVTVTSHNVTVYDISDLTDTFLPPSTLAATGAGQYRFY